MRSVSILQSYYYVGEPPFEIDGSGPCQRVIGDIAGAVQK